jgi:uncharacterized protein (TIGR00290 family)
MATEKTLFTWSGGKDSAMALFELRAAGGYEVEALLTTITEEYGRVSIHGVRSALLQRQADALGLRVDRVYIGKDCTDADYAAKMGERLTAYRDQGVTTVAFGDIFLEDLRAYRERNLAQVGLKALFPIWKRDTAELALGFIRLGFKAVVTCVDSTLLDASFVGREFDESFLAELPRAVDPCGENGEFHSFVYDGPLFSRPVTFERGDVVLRDKRFYCDLIPL